LKIPIQNIYYILCYAWNKLHEGEKVNVSLSDYKDSINLLGKVLVNGCRLLFKRGLDRNYNQICEEYSGVKGKIDFNESLNKNLFKLCRSVCLFDRFESDTLENQLLKATLYRLIKIDTVDRDLKKELWDCYWRFTDVKNINIDISLFAQTRIHRNNAIYGLLLNTCELIIENSTLDPKKGEYQFKDFIRSEKTMARLFEAFIRNFYKKEQPHFRVRQENIEWHSYHFKESSRQFLPIMQTDITLESRNRKIIIDAKYYTEALVSKFDGILKFRSGNLYQLYSYLRNIENKVGHPLNKECEGVLLYPTVNYTLDEQFRLGNHSIRIKTLDLNSDWRSIKKELLSVCSDSGNKSGL